MQTHTAPRRRPVHVILNTLSAPAPRREVGASYDERSAARAALLDGRDTPERAVDRIVDCLMKELSW